MDPALDPLSDVACGLAATEHPKVDFDSFALGWQHARRIANLRLEANVAELARADNLIAFLKAGNQRASNPHLAPHQ
jgi:hypothetical protein